MSIIQNVQKYQKRIAGDIVTVGGTVGALIAVLVNVAPSIHIPAQATAVLVAASAVVATVVQQARRVQRAKVAAYKAAVEVVATKSYAKKAPAKKATPAKRVAGK
jgi:hypothetical protein